MATCIFCSNVGRKKIETQILSGKISYQEASILLNCSKSAVSRHMNNHLSKNRRKASKMQDKIEAFHQDKEEIKKVRSLSRAEKVELNKCKEIQQADIVPVESASEIKKVAFVHDATSPLELLREGVHFCQNIVEEAKQNDDNILALKAIAEVRKMLETMGKLFEITSEKKDDKEDTGQININIRVI